MRKIYLLFLVLLLSMVRVSAQSSLYDFSIENGIYVPLSTGVVFQVANGDPIASVDGSPSQDSKASVAVVIPSFQFAGVSYTDIRVTSNGQLVFGTTGSLPSSTYTAISSSFADNKVLAPFGADLNVGAIGVSDVRYHTSGNITTVEWRNFRRYNVVESFSFQIKLDHTTGVIKFVYNGNPPYGTSTSYYPQIGIKNNTNDYQYLILGSGDSWVNAFTSNSGVLSSSLCKFSGPTGFIDGLTYVFTPPVPCSGTPNGGVVSISRQNLCSGATPAAISVANVNPGLLDISYKWQESTDNVSWTDLTGTASTTLIYTPPAYSGTTKYYRLKTTCANGNGVAYSNVSEVTGSGTPLSASTITFSNVTDSSMTISMIKGGGNRRMVVISDTDNFTNPIDGDGPALTGVATVYGGTGQQLVYDGTGTSVTVTLLSCSTTYYVRVYEYLRCGTTAPFSYWYALPLIGNQATTATSLSSVPVNIPEAINLTSFNGSNLSTISPGWDERSGDGPFTATTSVWTNSSVGGVTTARINLYTTTRKEWIISPPVNISVTSRVVFKAAMTASTSTNPASNGGMVGTDDKIQVMISTDPCGNDWTALYTIDSSNASEFGTSLVPKEVIIPNSYIGQNVRIGFKATDGPLSTPSRDYYFHLADIVIEALPPCSDVFGVAITNVTKNSATVSWPVSNPVPTVGYEYEVRTTGDPGTPGYIQRVSVPLGVTTVNLSELLPDTEYKVFVRTNCGLGMNGPWSEMSTLKTKCDYPELLTTTPVTRCGEGSVGLNATYDAGIVNWFSEQTGGTLLGSGNSFTTPVINSTTSYWVSSSLLGDNAIGGKLLPGGVSHTTASTYGLVFDAYSDFTLETVDVYLASTTAGNIVINLTNSSGTVIDTRTIAVPAGNATTPVLHTITLDFEVPAGVGYRLLAVSSPSLVRDSSGNSFPYGLGTLGSITGGYISGASTTYYYFYNWIVSSNCTSPRTEVVATVTPAPIITLSTDEVVICEGDSALVTVTAGASDYNSFVWSPATGVTGNATTGWTFNPLVSTVYTLTATQTTGSLCASIIDVNVNVNPLPLMHDLSDPIQACAGSVLELKVGDNTIWPSNYFNSFESVQLQGFGVSTTGNISASTTTLVSSVGARSLNITYESYASGYVTITNPLNLSNFSNPYLTFDHIAAFEGSGIAYDFGYVEYSLDNGTSWVVFKPADYVGTAAVVGSSAAVGQRFSTLSYPEWISVFTSASASPTNTLWRSERFNFPTNVNLSNVLIRFKVTSDSSSNYAGWFIDNVNVKEAPVTTATWLPVTNLYTDALATIPYVAGVNAGTVYFKSDVAMAATNYVVTVVSSVGCTVSQNVSVTNTFVATPVALAQSFCEEIEVTDIVVTGLTTGAVLKWYDSEISSTEVSTISTTGIYYVVQEFNGCSSVRVPVEISIVGIESAPLTDLEQVFCGNYTVADLVATPLSGNTIEWFNSETSVVALNLTDPLVSGVYYVSQYNGTCWSPRAAVTVSVNPVPAAPINVTQVFCGNKYLSEIDLGQDPNATLKWYETETSIDALSISTQLVTGTYTYYVSQVINGCESSRVEIQVVIQEQLPAPVAPATQLYCGVIPFSDLQATASVGGEIGWFTSSMSTTPIDGSQGVVTGTYYVAQYNGTCWSNKTIVQVTVNAIPSAPNNSDIHLCGNYNFGQVSIGQLPGATLNWYATASSTIPFAATTNVVGGTYYVSQTVGGCESPRVMINLSQTDSLGNPVAVSQTFCGSATVADLVAQGVSGASIIWYNSSVSVNALSPNATLVTGTYYVAQTVNGCVSSRVPISVFVVSVAAPNVDSFNFCGSATVANLVLPTPSGVTYKWFDSPSNPMQLDSNTALVTGTYFVSRTQYGCESLRTPVSVVINTVPNAPTGVSPQNFMEGATISDIVMDQSNVVWYISEQNAQNGINPLVQGMPLVNGTTYYGVIIGTNGCPSLPFALTVDVYLSDDRFVKEELKYYPNPVEDLLTISYSDRILQIEVFDLLGKRVKVKSTDDKEVNIDLSDLASGTYMIQLKTENKAQFIKIIKK